MKLRITLSRMGTTLSAAQRGFRRWAERQGRLAARRAIGVQNVNGNLLSACGEQRVRSSRSILGRRLVSSELRAGNTV